MRCESMDMTTLPRDWAQELNHFKRQYLQLQVTIKYPERQYLKHEEFQNELYAQIFSHEALQYRPPQRYQLRVLKELMKRVEDSITDWEEEVRIISLYCSLSLSHIHTRKLSLVRSNCQIHLFFQSSSSDLSSPIAEHLRRPHGMFLISLNHQGARRGRSSTGKVICHVFDHESFCFRTTRHHYFGISEPSWRNRHYRLSHLGSLTSNGRLSQLAIVSA